MAFVDRSVHEQGEAELLIFYLRSDIINILKGILALARLVPSSCASGPRNTREAGISSMYIDMVLTVY